jgi:GT2 family glycosyltransferase/glycosyltransferase involved in cell wall biosynthesis
MQWNYSRPIFEVDNEDSFNFLAWRGHRNFAYDLVTALRPKTVVELGTHYGMSFFSMCQAVKDHNYNTSLTAVDTWHGDQQAGFYNDDVFNTVQERVSKYYPRLSIRLVRKTFDDALGDFAPGSIDIMHIDGFHSYKAVRHDFETWFSKVSDNGVILFHDVHAYLPGFGVHMFWKEIKRQYPTLEFYHSYGLGVLFKNKAMHAQVAHLESVWRNYYSLFESIATLDQSSEDPIKERLAQAQRHIRFLEQKNGELINFSQDLENKITLKEQERAALHRELITITDRLRLVYTSKFWHMRDFYLRIKWAFVNPFKFLKKYVWKGMYTYPELKQIFKHQKKDSQKVTSIEEVVQVYGLENLLDRSHLKTSLELSHPIDIIIPVYSTEHSYKFLSPLFESLLKNTTIPYRLIVIDDHSPYKKGVEYLEKTSSRFKNFLLIKNDTNLGFGESVNLATKHVKNHFVILNTDTEVPLGWLERLMAPLYANNQVATVTPFTNAGTIFSFPIPLVDNTLSEKHSLADIDNVFKLLNFDSHKELFAVPTGVGFCMGINYKVFKKLKGFRADVFKRGYGEENDFCMRAIKLGYKNILAPNLFVYHNHGGTFDAEEKKNLIQTHLKKIESFHPEYQDLVTQFIKKDPFKDLRNFAELLLELTNKKTEVIFTHSLGGGADLYLKEYVAAKKAKGFSVLVVRYILKGDGFILDLETPEKTLQWTVPSEEVVVKLLRQAHVKNIVVNNLVGYPDPLLILAEVVRYKKLNPGTSLYFKVHDFFCISPNYTLMSDDYGLYIEKDQEDYENNKHNIQSDGAGLQNMNILEWRSAWSNFLNHCKEIEVYSPNSEKIFKSVFRTISPRTIVVNPHKVTYISRKVKIAQRDAITNVAILGNINDGKGLKVLESLASYAEKNNVPIMFYLIGNASRSLKFQNVVVHGSYERSRLPDILEFYHIHRVFIPSIWPETFSYTTEEAMIMGLPVTVFDVGAPAERVRNYAQGNIVSLGSSETQIIEALTA